MFMAPPLMAPQRIVTAEEALALIEEAERGDQEPLRSNRPARR